MWLRRDFRWNALMIEALDPSKIQGSPSSVCVSVFYFESDQELTEAQREHCKLSTSHYQLVCSKVLRHTLPLSLLL